MTINKQFVQELIDLQQQQKNIENKIESGYDKLEPRIEEMRQKYRKVLNELQKEYDTQYSFCSYHLSGDRTTNHIREFDNYFVAEIGIQYRDGDCDRECIEIPYDCDYDDTFAQELKKVKRQEYLEKLKMKKTVNMKNILR